MPACSEGIAATGFPTPWRVTSRCPIPRSDQPRPVIWWTSAGQVALLGGHPRRCHRVEDVDHERAEVDGHVAAHPADPRDAVRSHSTAAIVSPARKCDM